MAAVYSMAAGSTSAAATADSNLSYSTTNLDWGSKGWTFLLFVRKSSWDLSPLCFDSLFQIIIIVHWYVLILEIFSSVMIVILIGFEIGSSLGSTVTFGWMLTCVKIPLSRVIVLYLFCY